MLRQEAGRHDKRLFTWQGRPIDNIDKVNTRAGRRVLQEVAIQSFRWHDLRHIWASRQVQNRTPSQVLQALGGGVLVSRWCNAKRIGRRSI